MKPNTLRGLLRRPAPESAASSAHSRPTNLAAKARTDSDVQDVVVKSEKPESAGTALVPVPQGLPRVETPSPAPAPSTALAVVPSRPASYGTEAQKFSAETMKAILEEQGVKPGHVQIVLRRVAETKEPLAKVMADFGFLAGEGVAKAVAAQTGFEYFPLTAVDEINRDHLQGLSVKEAAAFMPVGRDRDGNLLIAVADASTVNDALNAFHSEPKVRAVAASEHTIQSVYRKFFADTEAAFDKAVTEYTVASRIRNRSEEDSTTAGLVQNVYFAILRHACYVGASDLYLYRSEHVGIVRLKINGVGYIFRTISLELYQRIMTKMAQDNGNPEKLAREPVETVITITEGDAARYPDLASRYGFRLELAQSRGVTSAVIRILDKNSSATDLSQLPFDPATRGILERVTRTATGFFLVTGPTGSGKTTSLYSLLKSIDPVERSIQSIENPIEYKHGLWQQFELTKAGHQTEGQGFNTWLKALLRNAPDVILVGEVRDQGVANICMDAANTGHLVFATLHTNNATAAIARMKSFNIDMSMFGSSLLGILAQRLVQKLCVHCRRDDTSEETKAVLGRAKYLEGTFTPKTRGEGCKHCGFTGYRGRQMVYEVLEMTPDVRNLVESGASPSAISKAGMPVDKTMWACGMRLVAEGVTSYQALCQVANEQV